MIFSFENYKELELLRTENCTIERCDVRSKDGNHSLLWQFESGSKLWFNTDIGYFDDKGDGKDSRRPAFGVYVYNETPVDEKVMFEFYKGEEKACSFYMNINFKGWRSVFVRFDFDMEGTPLVGMDRLCLSANCSGRLFIDQLVTSNIFDPRSAVATFQVPFVGENNLKSGVGFANKERPIDLLKLIPTVETNEPYDLCDILKLKYRDSLFNDNPKINENEIQALINQANIYKNSHIEYINQNEIYRYGYPEYEKNHKFVRVREANELLLKLALLYSRDANHSVKDVFLDLIRHLFDQGLAEGSSMGVLHHIDYSMRNFYSTVFLMEDVLKAEGLFDHALRAMQWYSFYGTIFIDEFIPNSVTADTFNTLSQAYLIITLLHNHKPFFSQFTSWLNLYMKPTEGLTGLMKEDGGIFHHCGHYVAYGLDGLNGIMPVIYTLHGSEYAVNELSMQTLSRVMHNMRFYCVGEDFPVSLNGRHPHCERKLKMLPFEYYNKISENKINFEMHPTGHLTMNSACATFHRRDSWLVSVKGFSKYIWGNETYESANLYGRYISYNHFEILEGSQEQSGYNHLGFDWAKIPGSTTVSLPIKKMRSAVYNLDNKSGFEEMLISDQAFAGGVNDGRNGMFAMKIAGHPKYDKGHKATVSNFFYDNFVVCLGSDIENDIDEYETITTVYQKTTSFDKDKHRYYFKDAGNVVYRNGLQFSENQNGSGETHGCFNLCYINHGYAPKGAEYQYAIGINGADELPYEVLQKDNAAHIIKIKDTYFYAIFEPEKFKGCGSLEKVDHPILLMETNGKISICEPDLGYYDQDPSQYKNGERIEVSIYSREWNTTPAKVHNVNLVVNGKPLSLRLKGGIVNQI